MSRTLYLCSGLPLERPNSFSRQLSTLAGALADRGWNTRILDPRTTRAEISRSAPRGVLLLGYPEQFPWMADEVHRSLPAYLWAQFSKPPVSGSLGHAIPVPLTWITAMFLVSAGYPLPRKIIPHGVDTTLFRPSAPNPRRERGFVIGTVGANSRRKRFDSLLEAFAIVRRGLPEARLKIKTDVADKSLGFDLPAMTESLRIAEYVEIVADDLTDEQMAKFYRSLDLYVHGAEWEGFGIPVVEAMASGIPVAAVPTQGPGEILPYSDLLVPNAAVVQDGATVLRWASPADLAGSIIFAHSDQELRRRLALAGRREATTRFDINVVAESWERLIGSYEHSRGMDGN